MPAFCGMAFSQALPTPFCYILCHLTKKYSVHLRKILAKNSSRCFVAFCYLENLFIWKSLFLNNVGCGIREGSHSLLETSLCHIFLLGLSHFTVPVSAYIVIPILKKRKRKKRLRERRRGLLRTTKTLSPGSSI